ncbi:MAG: methionine adenosyltransferase [Nostocaceae cyanobacterium]|nr:methionine adenosyltransferase [Nostocaceae cyanobacterium]
MSNIIIEELTQIPIALQGTELVERKGIGHPDSMCDAMMEQISIDLCREYLANFGRILHHNIDKSLLVAGRTLPRLGGGKVLQPMRLVIGDRATAEYQGKRIDIGEIVQVSVKEWLGKHLRFVDPEEHIIIQNELQEGSPELTDLFERTIIGANDTSAAVGYAPLTETEQMVLATEHYLNSPKFKQQFPEAGEDVKVMGYRNQQQLLITVALAFVDRYIPDVQTYFQRKAEIQQAVETYLDGKRHTLKGVTVNINTLDDPTRGEDGIYLTVLGTSAEGGDGGQVGRGNRVNGVISLKRPMGTEAAAGKNPVSHVGKIYTLLTHRIAEQIYAQVPGLQEVYIWLGSQIGYPIDQPAIASTQVILQPGVMLTDVESAIALILEGELANIADFTASLARGELPVC